MHLLFFPRVTWDTAESHDKVPLIGHRVDLRADDSWKKLMGKKKKKSTQRESAGDDSYRLDHHLKVRLVFGHLKEGGGYLGVSFGYHFGHDTLEERAILVKVMTHRR